MTRSRPIRSAASFARLTSRERAAYSRTLEALGEMRRGRSLTAASRNAGTTPGTVRKYAGATIKRPGARYALGRDRLYRPVTVLTNTGKETLSLGRRDSTTVSRHWNAVGRYLKQGDSSELERFRGVSMGGYELESDLDVIDELAARGELEFESIYELS